MVANLSLSDGMVEIVGDNGAHYLAEVFDVYDPKDPYVMSVPSDKSSEEPLITLQFEENWRQREAFPLNRIRLTPNTSHPSDTQKLVEGQEAEVWRSKKEGHHCGFWKCTIKMVRDDFYGISYGLDDKINCKIDGKECNEIFTKDRIRPINPNPYLKTNPFFKFMVDVPTDLLAMNPNLVKSSETHKHFKSALSLISVNYDDRIQRLVCIGFADKDKGTAFLNARKGAVVLADTHFRAVKVEIELRSQIDVFGQQFKNLDEIIKIKDNEFEILVRVEEEFMRYAIGTNGTNIKKVLQMPGILAVDRVTGVEQNIFRVIATNRNSLRVAKELLQITDFIIKIPRDLVPHIIGKRGGLVQEMTDKSGLISIKVRGDEQDEKPKPYVPFRLIGTQTAIENANLLITFQMNCVKENIEIDKQMSPKQRRPFNRRFH